MLNVSSPSPLGEDQSSANLSVDNSTKVNNVSLLNTKLIRPTLNNINQSDSLSFEDNMKKTIYQYKVILLGSVCVGKTSLLTRYIVNEYKDEYKCTIKTDFKTKLVNVNNLVQARLIIWDTCGDEKFKAITRQYYKDAQGIILVYDVTNLDSFNNINNWYKEVKDNSPKDAVVILVANKTDLVKERKVSVEEGTELAEKLRLDYIEISAKTGDNVYLLFERLSQSMMEQIENKSKLIDKKNLNYIAIIKEEKKHSCCENYK